MESKIQDLAGFLSFDSFYIQNYQVIDQKNHDRQSIPVYRSSNCAKIEHLEMICRSRRFFRGFFSSEIYLVFSSLYAFYNLLLIAPKVEGKNMEVEDTKMDYTNSDHFLETLTSHMRWITIQERTPEQKAKSLE